MKSTASVRKSVTSKIHICKAVMLLGILLAVLLAVPSAFAAADTWNGGGSSTNATWSNGANWGGTAPSATGDTLTFSGTTGLLNTNNVVTALATSGTALTFASGAGSFILRGNAITMGSGGGAGQQIIQQSSANNQEINFPINFSGGSGDRSIVFASGAGSLTLSGNIYFNNDWLFPNTTAGTIILSGSNTGDGKAYNGGGITAGANTMNAMMRNNVAGTQLTLGSDTCLGNSGLGSISAGTASFRGILANAQLNLNTTGGNRNLAGSTLAINNANNITFNGVNNLIIGNIINGDGNRDFVVSSSGQVTVQNSLSLSQSQTGRNLYLNLSGAGGMIVNGSIYDTFHSSGLTTAGSGTFRKAGTGTLTLNGSSSYADTTSVENGTLVLGNASAIGTGPLTLAGGNLDSSVANLTNLNNNTQNWNSDFTFVGSQNLNLGTGTVTPSASRQITVSASTLTIGGIIGGGTIALTKAGAGTLALAGANTYSGGTTVNAGTLQAGGTVNPFGTNTVTVSSGATLDLNGYMTTNVLSVTGVGVGGNGALINNNTGSTASVSNNIPANNFTVGGAGNMILTKLNQANSGQFTVTKVGNGTVFFSGGTLNYLMSLVVSNGTVVLNKANADTTFDWAIDRGLTIYGGTLKIGAVGEQIQYGQGVTINGGAFDLGGFSPSFNYLAGSGGVVTNSGGTVGTLTLGASQFSSAQTSANYAGSIVDGASAQTAVTLSGTNTMTLTGTNTYTGATTISSGTWLVDGAHNQGATGSAGRYVISSGATLGGNGTIQLADTSGSLTGLSVSGTLAPGDTAVSNGIGTLKIDATHSTRGSLALESGGKLTFRLGTNFTSSQVALVGGQQQGVYFNNNVINFVDTTTGNKLTNGQYVLFSADSANAYNTGTYSSFRTDTNGYVTAGLSINNSSLSYSIGTLQVVGNNIVLNLAVVTNVPAAPTGVGALAGNNSVFINWNAATNATSYSVKRATVSGGPYTAIATNLATTSYTDNTATNGTTYYYVVTASNVIGESPNSAEVSATPYDPALVRAISVNIRPIYGYGMAWTDVAGIRRVDHWNNLVGPVWTNQTVTLTNAKDNLGAVQSGFSASFTAGTTGTGYDYNGTLRLDTNATVITSGTETEFNGGNELNLYTSVFDQYSGTPSTLVVTNVPYTNYDVVIYIRSDTSTPLRGGSIALGGVTKYIRNGAGNVSSNGLGFVESTATSNAGSSTMQGNYVRFAGVSSNNFSATMVALNLGDGTQRLKIAGFQIISDDPVTNVAPVSAPAVPTNVVAYAGNAQVAINWNASATATNYLVKRNGTLLTSVSAPKLDSPTAYVDATAVNGTTYSYTVAAVNSAGTSADSTGVSATPQLPSSFEAPLPQEWQYSVPVTPAQSDYYDTVTNDPTRRAFLWVPPGCTQVRAVVFSLMNMIELKMLESASLRAALATNGIGIVWVSFGSGHNMDMIQDPNTGPQPLTNSVNLGTSPGQAAVEVGRLLTQLAAESGYSELQYCPIISFQHSASSPFGWVEEVFGKPALAGRVVSIINKGYYPGNAPRGIPCIHLTSEWAENAVAWSVVAGDPPVERGLRAQQGTLAGSQPLTTSTNVLFGELMQVGEGHYQSDFMSDSTSQPLFIDFIINSLQQRLPAAGTWSGTNYPTLTDLNQTNGGFIDVTHMYSGDATAVTFAQWVNAHPDDTLAKRAFWYPNLAYAQEVAAYANAGFNKTPQFVTPINPDGSFQNLFGVIGAAEYYPTIQSDGITFQVKAGNTTTSPSFRLNNAGPVTIGSAPIKYIHTSGALRQVGPDTFQMWVDRGDIQHQSLPWDNFISAYNRGDATHRAVDRPMHIDIPIFNTTGAAQTLTFPAISNQIATSMTNIILQATASSGLPVQYWMNCGPYLITNSTLPNNTMIPQTLPVRATFPMRVMVGAYQWGTRAGTQYASSADAYQTFWIFQNAGQKSLYETYGTLNYSNVITGTTATNGPQAQAYWTLNYTAPTIMGGINPVTVTQPAFNHLVLGLTNATGTAQLTYQWVSNGVAILNATNASYTNLSAKVSDSGNYTCVVSDPYNSITSSVANVTITKATPIAQSATTASAITYGQTLNSSTITVGNFTNTQGQTVTLSNYGFVSSGIAPNAGVTNVTVYYLPNDSINYYNMTNNILVTVNPASSVVTLTGNTFAYDGTAKTPAISVSGSTGIRSTNYTGIAPTSYNSAAAPVNAGSYTLTVGVVSDANYIGATNHLNFMIGQATTTITLGMVTNFLYNGTAQTPTNVIGSSSTGTWSTNYVGLSPTVYGPSATAPTNAGSYELTNAVVSDGNWIGATNGLQFTIGATNVTITAVVNLKSYDGTTNAAAVPTVTAGNIQTGNTATLTEAYTTVNTGMGLTLVPAVVGITNAAGADVSSNYNVTLANSNAGEIDKVNAVFTVTTYSVTYDGNPHTASISAITGVNGEMGATVGSVDVSGTTHTGANIYNGDAWTFTGGANYNNTSGMVTDTISAATPTVTPGWSGGTSFTYNGAGQGPTLSSVSTSPQSTGTTNVTYLGISGTTYAASAQAPTNAGSYQVTVTINADANNNQATSSAYDFTIGQTISSWSYTGSTFTYNGLGQTPVISFSGSTGVKTTNYVGSGYASVNAPTNAGAYYMSNTVVADANYFGATNSQAFTINQAVPTFSLISSEYPAAGYKDSLTFTANSFSANASGTVQFQTNGDNLGGAVTISGGSAVSVAASGLPRATTNLVAAIYSGDNNYLSLTNTLTQTVTNHPPVATVLNVLRTAGLSVHIALTNLVVHWLDADGDTINLIGVAPQSTNHIYLQEVGWSGAITTNTANFNHFFIAYTNSPNVNDQFTYTISDNYGGTNTGTVNVIVNASALFGQSNPQLTSIPGGVQMTFYGIPGNTYVVQRELQLDNSWINLLTNTPVTGPITITDTNNPSAYYRLLWQP